MNDILNKLHEAAASPRAQMDGYLSQGKKIVLCAPVYTPEELIHAMGFVPMGAWGGDVALNRAKEYCKEKGKDLKIEIEVRNFDELQQVLDLGGVDRIMFDNFTPEMTKKAVDMVAGKYETESSGGITFDTLRDYAECGVDFISVGALTHSVKGLDMSFKAC